MEFELHILAATCMELLLMIFFCWEYFFLLKFVLLLLETVKLLKKEIIWKQWKRKEKLEIYKWWEWETFKRKIKRKLQQYNWKQWRIYFYYKFQREIIFPQFNFVAVNGLKDLIGKWKILANFLELYLKRAKYIFYKCLF